MHSQNGMLKYVKWLYAILLLTMEMKIENKKAIKL